MIEGKYSYIIILCVTFLISQFLKFLLDGIKKRKFDLKKLINGNGGMISSHCSPAVALTTAIGINQDLSSPVFAVVLSFTVITIIDAVGVRKEVERHAEILIEMIEKDEIQESDSIVKKLKSKVGHEPIEVLRGIILGIVIGTVLTIK